MPLLPTVIRVKRLRDRTMIDKFKALLAEEQREAKVTGVEIAYIHGGDNTNIKKLTEEGTLEIVLKHDTIAIWSCTIRFGELSIAYRRPIAASTNQNERGLKDWHDEVVIQAQQQQQHMDVDGYMKLVTAARKHFESVDDKDFKAILPDHMREFYAGQDQAIQQLKELQADLIRKGTELTVTLASQTLAKHKELETHFTQREKDQDDRHAQKEKALADRERAFEENKKKFDDSENMLLRRQMFEKMLERISQRITNQQELDSVLSKHTRTLRWPVNVLYIVLLIASALLVALAYFYMPDNPPWHMALRPVAVSFVFFGIAVYYVRWLNQWFLRHANEEFSLKRFQMDIHRANYLAELAMEWKKATKEEMPAELLHRISNNLFAEDNHTATEMSPADLVASALFGAAAQLKVKTSDGTELLLDRKSIQNLKKPQEDGKPN